MTERRKWSEEDSLKKILSSGILQENKLKEIAERIQDAIGEIFDNSGIYYRIFYRIKTEKSLSEKLTRDGYGIGKDKKRMQDLIGLRIVLYYSDDLHIGQKIMQDTFLMVGGWEKTEQQEDQFAASKINGVFRIPEEFMDNYQIPVDVLPVDNVFELQFRTMFFEGWHEIEHDMRYKTHFADDAFWKGNPALSRMLNCIVANLELCDWSMINLFDQLAEYHYRAKNWEMMLKSRFRLHMSDEHLSPEFCEFFDRHPVTAEKFYHCTRSQLIECLMGTIHGDVTYNLIIRILNEKYVQNQGIWEICEKLNFSGDTQPYSELPLLRLESSDVFCMEVQLCHKEGNALSKELRRAAEIIQLWAKNKICGIFEDVSEKPENYRRRTLGYQLITNYNEQMLYYELEMYHLDMEHPGTLWQIQVLVQRVKLVDQHLTLWVHNVCRHPHNTSIAATFSKPVFVNEIASKIGLQDVELLKTTPLLIGSDAEFERLIHLIDAQERSLPVVVLAAAQEQHIKPLFTSSMHVEAEKQVSDVRRQLHRKKGEFCGILHAGKLAHIIGIYAHVCLLDRESSEKFAALLNKPAQEVFGSVSIFESGSGMCATDFFTEQMILDSRFDYNRYVYYEGDVYEKAFRHKLVEMIKRKVLKKHG